ncbi:hypothetical protein SAMN05444920_105174 [Nonomuraea solani]|uniref:Uncharacterized protein n=1 Tax=Nonomuraea solani TaxID=1144553 RepID=A0A1H6DCY0_9ACTN|nr:hypothetical protein SAMN05444920_105174 [Nonomuraea solani]
MSQTPIVMVCFRRVTDTPAHDAALIRNFWIRAGMWDQPAMLPLRYSIALAALNMLFAPYW